jgi:hypothetical protein
MPPKGRPKTTALERVNRAMQLRERDDGGDSLAFNPAPLTMACLPYRQPKAGTEVWVRRNGAYHLTVRPGVRVSPSGDTSRYGFPFGVVPRALLMWVTAEALRTESPLIMLGDSLADFVFKVLGQRATGGVNGTSTRVKQQATRLFNAGITYHWIGNTDRFQAGVNLNIAKAWEMDLGDGQMGQESLFPSYVQLSADFYEEIVKSPVPLNLEVVRLLGSAAEIDLYAWLTYKMFRLTKPFTHKWEDISAQFGYQFSETSKGRYKLREAITMALRNVQLVYPEVNVEVTPAGLLLRPSLTSVPLKGTRELRSK